MDKKITYVLPIKGEIDIFRSFNILIRSIEKYFHLDDIFEFIIIYNNDDYEKICKYIEEINSNLKINLIDETSIIRDYDSFYRLNGWKRQQILKLEISKIVKTDIYMTLDSDVFMIRKCSLQDFYKDGKIIYNITSVDCHREWWVDSCKILNCDFETNQSLFSFGVTPGILVKNVVLELLDYLHINCYSIFLMNETKEWTEYTLYWIFAVMKNYNNVYINKNPKNTIHIKYKTVDNVKDTIQKLERLYKAKKYPHKRIWQVGMIMKVRLGVLRNKKPTEYKLASDYLNFLSKRTSLPENERYHFKFSLDNSLK